MGNFLGTATARMLSKLFRCSLLALMLLCPLCAYPLPDGDGTNKVEGASEGLPALKSALKAADQDVDALKEDHAPPDGALAPMEMVQDVDALLERTNAVDNRYEDFEALVRVDSTISAAKQASQAPCSDEDDKSKKCMQCKETQYLKVMFNRHENGLSEEEAEKMHRRLLWNNCFRISRVGEGVGTVGSVLGKHTCFRDKFLQYQAEQADMFSTLDEAAEQFCEKAADEYMRDSRGNLVKYTQNEDLVSLKIYQKAIEDCIQERDGGYLTKVIKEWSEAIACPVNGVEWSCKDPEFENWCAHEQVYEHIEYAVNGTKFAAGHVRKMKVSTITGQQIPELKVRVCEGGDFSGEDIERSKSFLAKLVQNRRDATDDQQRKQACKELFAYSSANDNEDKGLDSHPKYKGAPYIFKYFDNVRCDPDSQKKPGCKRVEKWIDELFESKIFSVSKGRNKVSVSSFNYAGLDNAKKEELMSEIKEFSEQDKVVENCRAKVEKDPKGRVAVNSGGKFASTTGAGVSDEAPNCSPKAVQDADIYMDMAHSTGKNAHAVGSNTDAFKFLNCGAPFLGGISGTIAHYLRVTAAAYENPGDLPLEQMMTLIAITELGGHHTLTELLLTAKHFYEYFAQGEFSQFSSVPMPFNPEGEDVDPNSDTCAFFGNEENHLKYMAMMKSFENLAGYP